MAEIVAGFGVPHTPVFPFFVERDGPDCEIAQLFRKLTEHLEQIKPDLIVMFDTDHLNTFFLDNLPIFAVGVADDFKGPIDEVRSVPVQTVKSRGDVAAHLRDAGVHAGFDISLLQEFGVDFNCSFILGGQIAGNRPRLFMIYAAGNFIEASVVNPYFQIGEAKNGKPIIDRVLTPSTPLDEAAKCALVSMDSTMKSNLSVGPPLDLVVYEANRFETDRIVCIDMQNPYFRMLHSSWGQKLREVFDSLEDPVWDDSHAENPLLAPAAPGGRNRPLKKITRPDEKLI